ncbi:conserved exported hypothetical protein [Burkholderia sp. 8Y]|uniref:hypothetical protein n=1 Tax=Burkholderia sp. 8Y TaxID=2653133 RepID=UPI0012EF27C5|nr:hypothetical protein [Burkholderia sp. 8Y]VXC75456.1 conserved exported hypothetical protein [Burkholderia sp. 8Y]
MKPSHLAGIALLAGSCAALAQQPLSLPGRSQSAGQQAVDNAACYAYANQTTKVNMARESQSAPKQSTADTRTMSPPRPVEPPLPPTASGALAASAASPASGASGAVAASGASAARVAGASAPRGASAAMPASGAGGMGGMAGMPAMPGMASGASDALYGGDMKMPPLPPPEPPMARYWRAYSECMQNRGYFVR